MYDILLERWLAETRRRTDLSPRTIDSYLRVSRILVAFQEPDARTALADFVTDRRDAGISPRTIALYLRVMSVALHWNARANGGFAVPLIPRVRVDRRAFVCNHRTPTPAHAAAAIRAMKPDDFRLVTRILAATGARAGEVLALRGLDLDEETGRLALGAHEGARKTGLRWFPLDAATLRALEGRSARGARSLFDLGVGSPFQAFQRRLRDGCRAAGVPEFSPHGLRRMVVGRLLKANVDAATAASLTGHSIDVMLKYYRDVTEDDRRDATERAMLGVLDELPAGR